MPLDLASVLAESQLLSKRNAELHVLKRALAKYQGDLHAGWSGPEVGQIDFAIARINEKISRAQRLIDAACASMNRGAAAVKTEEGAATLEAKVRAINGDGGMR